MSPRPFDPELLPEGHPDRIAVPPRRTVSATVWRGLVRYLLLPSYRGLVALGSTHVAGLWHPEFGPLCREPRQDPPSSRAPRPGVEGRPEAWPAHPTPSPEIQGDQ